MLKIKDNVDLKELEKFGFRKRYSTYYKNCIGKYKTAILWINARKNDNFGRMIGQQYWESNEVVLDTIYDLIQAGLVEKVEEL